MTLATLTEFFKWWVVFGGILYIFTAVTVMFASNLIYSIQSRMINLKEETFKVVLYSYMAIFKILYLLFILIPYLSLLKVG